MSVVQGPGSTAAQDASDILERIARGDRAAEAEFVRRYQYGVLVLVRRHCRPNDPIVEDLAQDVLTRVLERLREGAVRDPAALPAYVRTTVMHTTSAEYRSRRVTEPESTAEHVADGDAPPERLSSAQLSGILKKVLDDLPVARDREVLARFYLDEHDKDSVCRALNIDAAHFHRVVFRARERFRALLMAAGIGEA